MYRRHDLLEIKNVEKIIEEVASPKEREALSEEIFNIPAIVRRQDGTIQKKLQVGFSFPFKVDGIRFRIACSLDKAEITESISPYQVTQIYNNRSFNLNILDNIIESAKESEVEVGIFGSAALEIVTGYSYLDSNSDLDILVKSNSIENLKCFYSKVKKIEKNTGKLIDIELEIQNGFAIKLKEFLSDTATIIAKGLYSVELMTRDEIKLLRSSKDKMKRGY
ncbi:malonate decarboxylase holo-[acyl-carrier-protein] synthase [uncultured Ilyobacter sp.]|uniref:malonate decarboxylase holo-[acyl-carrier-protein] synthase n=1 Tax=uncultured Ilyobacter sp. TaxID=544433 RepID=UPI002AA907F2|nr:malonate decarboxylase holo-[acyl-carrier-protein] synthase [uncultured Ilyobacter sp.]